MKLWNRRQLLAVVKEPFSIGRCKTHHIDDGIFLQPQLKMKFELLSFGSF